MIQDGIDWPFAVLDFEASALDPDSYPIEVGIAIWDGPVAPIRTWTSLIEPTPDWCRNGVWFEAAQKIHGISPADLTGAPRPASVLSNLNALLGAAGSAISDNPQWEAMWLNKLADAAGDMPCFTIDGLADRLRAITGRRRQRLVDHVRDNPRPHRAGEDALLMVQALAHALERTPEIHPAHLEAKP